MNLVRDWSACGCRFSHVILPNKLGQKGDDGGPLLFERCKQNCPCHGDKP